MKTEPLITNSGLADVNLSTLNPKYLSLDSVRTDNAHVKEFVNQFQSEFWQAHRIKIHHSVVCAKSVKRSLTHLVWHSKLLNFKNSVLQNGSARISWNVR